jgi:hypothetical protein
MELIDGERFDRWVRPHDPARAGQHDDTALDETRLRAALSQLCDGIAAIHGAGKLHRDLKPSNVLVTPEGRVVVLDFGLVVDPEQGGVGQTVMDGSVAGTPGYMAPEQAAGLPATAASDFYALGVMLFEALTGKLPFEGRAADMLVDKQRETAPLASAFDTDAPRDLDALCALLLERVPAARPDADALRALVGPSTLRNSNPGLGSRTSAPPGAGESLPPLRALDRTELLGRESELCALREAFTASCAGKKPVIVLLSGESGIGKSALCEVFLSELRTQREAVVLSGRCFERESVPFKAFDVVVDALSRHLRKLPERELLTLLPRDAFTLRRIFPVLGRIAAIAEAPERGTPDAHELRRRAFAAFGELLGRMRDRQPLVLHLDDLQWSDADSTLLLMHLLRQADAPHILLIASHRSEQMQGHPYLVPLYEALPPDIRLDVRTLALLPLETVAAHALLGAQLGDRLSALVREAGGNPFLLRELGRHVAAHADEPATELSLKNVVMARVEALPEAERALLQVLAVAARPIDLTMAVQAAGVRTRPRPLFEALRDAYLARATGDGAMVECFHDKVRDAVLGALSAEALRTQHAALAQALASRTGSDAEQLAVHLLGAGESERAAVQLARAADAAFTELSFDRAARLYTQALAHGRFEPAEKQRLQVAHADALAEAGRGPLAAEAYLAALHSATGPAAHALEQRAAEQYLFSGRLEEGRTMLARSLRRHGVRLPSSNLGARTGLSLERGRLRLRGLEFRERPPDPVVTRRLELLNNSGVALGRLDSVRASALIARHLRLALEAGDAAHVACGLTDEIWNRTLGIGDVAEVPHLIARVEALLARIDAPAARLGLHYMRGYYRLHGPAPDHEAALQDFDRYLALLSEQHYPYASYRRSMGERLRVVTRVLLGRFAEVARELPGLHDAAWERGDFAVLPLLADAHGAMALVAVGALGEAERALARATAAWSSCRNAYAWQDLSLLQGAIHLALARGEPRVAWQRVQEDLPRFSDSPMRSSPLIARAVHASAAQAALALAAGAVGNERAELLRFVKRRLAGPIDPRMTSMLAIALAHLEGHTAHAIVLARADLAQADGVRGPHLHQHMKRRALGVLLGGDEGSALVAEADAFLHQGGAIDAERFFEMLSPGLSPR